MEFRFNFEINTNDCSGGDFEVGVNRLQNSVLYQEDLKCDSEATEIKVTEFHEKQCNKCNSHQTMKIGSHIIELISPSGLEKYLCKLNPNDQLSKALQLESDLVPGVYEGGLKIWECSLDLADYIYQKDIISPGMYILEIGCGAGIPGLIAYKHGGYVHFQDYNCEVLNYVTIPNLLMNATEKDDISEKCRFFVGEWSSVENFLCKNVQNMKYDVILTSETIYNPKNQGNLLNLMKNTLKESGVVYVAAKAYYFGVGGGTQQFKDLVSEDGAFDIFLCKTILEGVQREIYRLTFKNSNK